MVKDLDNSFGYPERGSAQDVSPRPIGDVIEPLGRVRGELAGSGEENAEQPMVRRIRATDATDRR